MQQNHTICDMGLWDGEIWTWNLLWRGSLYHWEQNVLNSLLSILDNNQPTPASQDSFLWQHDLEKGFTVRSFTEVIAASLYNQGLNDNVFQFIWRKVSPPRAELLLWFIAKDKLKTRSILHNLNLINEDQATIPFCSQFETSTHLFLTCDVVWQI